MFGPWAAEALHFHDSYHTDALNQFNSANIYFVSESKVIWNVLPCSFFACFLKTRASSRDIKKIKIGLTNNRVFLFDFCELIGCIFFRLFKM